jgi:hypothetical protein
MLLPQIEQSRSTDNKVQAEVKEVSGVCLEAAPSDRLSSDSISSTKCPTSTATSPTSCARPCPA